MYPHPGSWGGIARKVEAADTQYQWVKVGSTSYTTGSTYTETKDSYDSYRSYSAEYGNIVTGANGKQAERYIGHCVWNHGKMDSSNSSGIAYAECEIPADTLDEGKELELYLNTYWHEAQSGGASLGYRASVYVDSNGSKDYFGKKSASSSGVSSTGPRAYLDSSNKTDEYMVASKTMSKGNLKVGDRIKIVFQAYADVNTECLSTATWTYELKEKGSSSTTTTTTTTSDDDDEAANLTDSADDADLGQVSPVKVTNKKVKRIYVSFGSVGGATGYEIRYSTSASMSGAKKFATKSTKGYISNKKGKKLTFKKGKTYYVQVRAYAKDSSGDKIYGKWSAKKKVKIKK